MKYCSSLPYLGFLCIGIFLLSCKSTPIEETSEEVEKEIIESLPFQTITLTDLSSFKDLDPNWKIAGTVTSDFTQKHNLQLSEGTGVLVNEMTATDTGHLFTTWQHGDMELELDFMMPKGSNSGIYFQGRYEIQLLDSWSITEPQHSDCGGIYERWDDTKPEGQQGYEGHPPRINAALAPGLWQHYHIIFRAPRFDANGQKTQNAKFEKVVHNGVVIHENVEVTGPTRAASAEDEVALAPLMIQGDHGPVAFRNIKYKLYGADTLTLSNTKYDYYEVETPITTLPDFEALEVIASGETDLMDVNKLSKRRDGVAFQFKSELMVKKAGEYLFHLYSDDGSRLFIDGEEVVNNDGKHDLEPKRGLINLTEGTHELQIDYFNNSWGKGMILMYEGPEQQLRVLDGLNPYPPSRTSNPVLVDAMEVPELVRGFVNYGGKKRTHSISVGDPNGVHYSYDLRNGALLKVWKGGFADVTNMWQGRGHSQLLIPQTFGLELAENALATTLQNDNAPYPTSLVGEIVPKGYSLNTARQPVFKYEVGNAKIQDHYAPSEDGKSLTRTLVAESGNNLTARAGIGDYIQKVNDDYYVIDGNNYIKVMGDAQPIIREQNGKMEMLFPLEVGKTVQYGILW